MTESKAKWEYCRAIDLIKRIKTEETHERYIDRHKAFDLAIKALEEIQQYRAIGTVEECRVAVEKMKPKKPIDRCMYKECPCCGNVEIENCGHCPECGQAIDWSE